MLHMSRRETLATRYGEMLDLLNCYAIHNGSEPKEQRNVITSFEEAMEVD